MPVDHDTHQERRTLTVREVGAQLGVPLDTIRGWVRRGVLRSVRIGGRRLIPIEALEEVLRSTAANDPDAVRP